MENTGVVRESQLDWLTSEAHSAARNLDLEAFAVTVLREREAADNRVSPFRLNGYIGWHCGRISYGTRDAAGLLQLSGELAEEHFATLVPIADHFSRLDLAVTVDTGLSDPDLGQLHYLEACEHRDSHPKAALPWQVQDADGGYTLYLGKRTSDFFLRVYNKEAESIAAGDTISARQYARCWRYELELKGGASRAITEPLHTATDRTQYVRNFLYQHLTQHGMMPPFAPTGEVRKLAGLRRRSDRISRLNWLATSVRPTVRWLIETGNAQDVLDALDLTSPNGSSGEKSGEQPF